MRDVQALARLHLHWRPFEASVKVWRLVAGKRISFWAGEVRCASLAAGNSEVGRHCINNTKYAKRKADCRERELPHPLERSIDCTLCLSMGIEEYLNCLFAGETGTTLKNTAINI